MVQSYKKSLVINVKNKTKINQIDNILTFEVPFLVFLSQNYNLIGTEPEANIVSVSAITHCMVQEKAYRRRSIGFFLVSTCLEANPNNHT